MLDLETPVPQNLHVIQLDIVNKQVYISAADGGIDEKTPVYIVDSNKFEVSKVLFDNSYVSCFLLMQWCLFLLRFLSHLFFLFQSMMCCSIPRIRHC